MKTRKEMRKLASTVEVASLDTEMMKYVRVSRVWEERGEEN